MIGSVSGFLPAVELGRIQGQERDKPVPAPAEAQDEDADRGEAALDEARGDRSVIVEQAEALLDDLRSAAVSNQSRLRIEQDEETGGFIYKSIDRVTGETLKEWPPEKVRHALAFLNKLNGAFIDRNA